MVLRCASLVVQDEEEHLVQFAHHSVKELLLSRTLWHPLSLFGFRLPRANMELAETCLTYPTLDVFKRQLVTTPQNQVSIKPLTRQTIVRSSLSACESPIIYRSWLRLEEFLGGRFVHNNDAWGQLCSLQAGLRGTGLVQDLQSHHPFLAYASEHWLSHTASLVRKDPSLWDMWRCLVLVDDTVATRPWTIEQWSSGDERAARYIVEQNHWALATLFQSCGYSLTVK